MSVAAFASIGFRSPRSSSTLPSAVSTRASVSPTRRSAVLRIWAASPMTSVRSAADLALRAREQVLARRLELAGEIAAGGGHLPYQGRPVACELGGNGPRQRTGGHSRGVKQEDGLYCHPGHRGQQGAKQRRLQRPRNGRGSVQGEPRLRGE